MASPLGTPKSPEQSEKSKKYDRQLRLWGDHGQSALENAKVCLLNATATGTEALKSLVLPGVGSFTIVDGHKVTGEDVGNNFFLEQEWIGKPRAQATTQLLLELNQDVRGDFVDEDPQQLLQNSPDFFNNFSLVIATALPERTLVQLSARLWLARIPLIVCRSYGLVGTLRVQLEGSDHAIVETHPESQLPDLRLDKPFPALRDFLHSFNLDEMSKKEHAHIPYPVVLFQALRRWREQNPQKDLPKDYKDREDFRKIISEGIRKNEDGDEEDEENFQEALKAVNTAVVETKIPQTTQEIFNHEFCLNLTAQSSHFWIMVRALKEFVDAEGLGTLPVRGSIPDMTADSEKYITLQNVYREQANKDAETVYRWVQQLLSQIGQSQESISENEVRNFCRNAPHLKVLKGTSIADEYDPKTPHISDITQNLENPDSNIVYYVMLRGVERFYSEYNVYPGEFEEHVEPDVSKLKACISRLLSEWGCSSLAKDDYVHEFCRYGAAEVHSVAAFIGGCAAHEAIKLITKQYIPLDNTFVYNAINSTSSVFQL